MTRIDILSVLIRIMGIYYLVEVIITIPNFIYSMTWINTNADRGIDKFSLVAYSILISFIYLAIGYIFIAAADKIAGKLIPTANEISFNYSPEIKKDILVLMVRIIGIIFLIIGLPRFIGYGLDMGYKKYWNYFDYHDIQKWMLGDLLTAIAQMIVGLFLLYFAGKIVRRFSKDTKPKVNIELE